VSRARRASVLAVLCAALALSAPARAAAPAARAPAPDRTALGRLLFLEGCSSCHGADARGIEGRAPSLYGAGAGAADFYLTTGRMPLDDPGDPPLRTRPAYGRDDIAAIVAYVGSLGGSPIPTPHPELGSLSEGLQAFTEHCAGCHQVVAKGGIVTGAAAPALDQATPVQIAEAVRTGPYLMPEFPPAVIGDHELDSIIRYIELTKHPDNRGGAGIGNIGPIPEGMVAWLVAGVALLIVARLIGERSPS